MDNPLSKLAIDYWYQAVIVVSAVIFILCGMGSLNAFPVAPTASISAGGFFIGLGEWVNHPLQTTIIQPGINTLGGVISGHPRNNKPIGVFFVIIGFLLVGYGIYALF